MEGKLMTRLINSMKGLQECVNDTITSFEELIVKKIKVLQ